MTEAASCLIGENDFRNLCKMDVGNGVVAFRRYVKSARIYKFSNDSGKNFDGKILILF